MIRWGPKALLASSANKCLNVSPTDELALDRFYADLLLGWIASPRPVLDDLYNTRHDLMFINLVSPCDKATMFQSAVSAPHSTKTEKQ